MVSSAIYEGRGTVQTLRVLFKSLGGSMGGGVMSLRPSSARTLHKDAGT